MPQKNENVNVSSKDAQQALSDIRNVTARTRAAIAHSGVGPVLVLWGLVWLAGFLITHFQPDISGWAWLALDGAGMAGTFAMMARHRRKGPVRSGVGARAGFFWLLLIAYGILWLAIFHPSTGQQTGAFICTLVMFAYVIFGLLASKFFLGLGLGVTAITTLAFFLLEPYFFLIMAVAGGGSLIAAGLYTHRRWR